MEREREHMHTILTGGWGRRRGLALALSTSALALGLMGVGTGTASAATCDSTAAISVNSYTIVGTAGTRTETSLAGKVDQGDSIIANFTVNAACPSGVVVNFPSYLAPGPTWDATTASQQQVFDPGTGTDTTTLTYPPGPNTIQTTVGPGCFQVDLVVGPIIQTFSPPSGTYAAQGRKEDSDLGDPGCTPLV
jgi:hypothetical protein